MDTNKYGYTDQDVVVIIGSGAGGGTLANELCQKGIKVVLLEAGKRESPQSFIQDEWKSFEQLAWTDNRTTSGSWRVAKDFPNLPAWICKTVGGTTTHWAGASLRFQEHEFKAKTHYGTVKNTTLIDWPITLSELEPYYALAEYKMGVTRTNDAPGLPGNNNFKVLYNGATKLGYTQVSTGHMAINSRNRDGRPQCTQQGFCFQGCKMGAKWSTLYTEIPKAEATGLLDLRTESHAARIEHDDAGKVTGVIYFDANGKEHRQAARVICVAGNSIETPRLLLLSESGKFKNGLANSSDHVGRNYMRHVTGSVYAVFEDDVHMNRGTVMAGIVQDEAKYDPKRGFVGGYELETISLGLAFYATFLNPGGWGKEFASYMDNYTKTAGLWIVGEDMPQATNRVTLNRDALDQFGLPVSNVHYDDHPNDVAMRDHAFKQSIAMYEAAGAVKSFKTPPYPSTHNLGSCRMSNKHEDGVCNSYGQTHDINNLFISDGSQFTSSASENPTLTIVALAIRQAEYIAKSMGQLMI